MSRNADQQAQAIIEQVKKEMSVVKQLGDALIEGFLPREQMNCYERAITPIIDKYLNTFALKHVPLAINLYNALVAGGHDSEENSYEHNDMDNHAWYLPHDKAEIICLTSQNTRYMYILTSCSPGLHSIAQHAELDPDDPDYMVKLTEMHQAAINKLSGKRNLTVYKFYDEVTDESVEETYTSHEFLTKGDYHDLFSDNIPTNQYVRKPDIKWFITNKFCLEKESCFIHPIIAAYECGSSILSARIGRVSPVYHYADVNMSLWELKVTSDMFSHG
jgi:hypothetical protein